MASVRQDGRARVRRGIGLVLFAAGCFGLGLAAARWLGWVTPGPGASPYAVPTGAPASSELGPRIYVDAGAIELYDGSLTIDPPPPPRVPEE